MSLIVPSALALVTALEAHAAQPEHLGPDQLIQSAGLIFEGRVVEVDPDRGDTGRPLTRVTVEVGAVYAGEALPSGQRLSFMLPQGRLPDGRVVEIVEAPRFTPGVVHLMFYSGRVWHLTPIVGWQLGVIREVIAAEGRVWALADGRCIGGLGRGGFVSGPLVTAPATSPLLPEAKRTGWMPPESAVCLPADVVRAQLRARIAELPAVDRGPIHRVPALDGRWPLDPDTPPQTPVPGKGPTLEPTPEAKR